jgi:phosphoglycolate phosphatase-like HAD superfamily hydrolase
MAVYLIDIDGTLADTSHRQWVLEEKRPYGPNWELFFCLAVDDKPFPHMQQLLSDLHQYWVRFVYVTGRPERYRQLTEDWLDKHDFPAARHLYMRKDGDHRPDHIVKRELLDLIRVDGFTPVMAFDDRNSVVKMWREAGVPCAQVAEGNF